MKKQITLPITILSLLSVGLLSGCSTLSKKDCESLNWERAGYQAALKGEQVQAAFNQYQNSCRQVSVAATQANGDDFAKGYDNGREVFCTPANMHEFAKYGGVYTGICPDSKVNSNFMTSYQSGREAYLNARISSLESEVQTLKAQVSSAESEAASLRGRQCP